ncbi:uncharacterized protein LOC100903507 [Galendromus occidentalis]|uniref:Uncharacterized protein LOC100903507 n=1 Tax=Galendromus occidentalis TaxID=34638 RepID=A0AAJ6QSK7_9ACAR|nr:uncharacterized protein LOC100903507 [Galendromus occidentalis]
MADSSQTMQILRSLELGLTTGLPEAIVNDLALLGQRFKIASEVQVALEAGALDRLRSLLLANVDSVTKGVAQTLAEAVPTLCRCGDTSAKVIQQVEVLLIFLRDNFLAVPERVSCADDVFRSMLRATEGPPALRGVVLNVFPLNRWSDLNFKRFSATAADELADTINNLSDRGGVNLSPEEVLEVLGLIADHPKARCRTVAKICLRAAKLLNVPDSLSLLRFIVTTRLVGGLMFHLNMNASGCRGMCTRETLALSVRLVSHDEDTNSRMVCQGLLNIVGSIIEGTTPGDLHCEALEVLLRCIANGSSMLDAVQNHLLLNHAVVCASGGSAKLRSKANEVYMEFLKQAKAHHFMRAMEDALFSNIAFFLRKELTVESQILLLTFVQKTLEKSVEINKERQVKDNMHHHSLHMIIPPLMSSSNAQVKNLATIINSRLSA